MRKLKCFIASAFDREDVDTIFSKVVMPVLRKQGISPIRVDRVEHNDDIDDKILELIVSCDFCIADLSYARPSVYYEAGRVHGMGKPVIFIARSDHFNPKRDDSFGNFRIHFDLQMKNIIKWTVPTESLQKRLASRVEVVAKPLLRLLAENDAQKQARILFNKLSQMEKLLIIVDPIKKALRDMKFHLETERWAKPNILAIKKRQKTFILVWCLVETSFVKSRLADIASIIGPHYSQSLKMFFRDMKIHSEQNIIAHILCCSLRPIPESRIADALPRHSPHELFKIYSRFPSDDLFHRRTPHEVFRAVHIHFLDGIDSILAIQDQLKRHLTLVGKLDVSSM